MYDPLQVLVVEDEPIIALMVEDFLDILGHNCVGIVGTVPHAIGRVAEGGFDIVILDVNLNGEPCWPVADVLADRQIPFVLATGGQVTALPDRHARVTTLPKPYTIEGLEAALERADTGP